MATSRGGRLRGTAGRERRGVARPFPAALRGSGQAGKLRRVPGTLDAARRARLAGIMPGPGRAGLGGACRGHQRPVGSHFLPVVSIGEIVPVGAGPVPVVIPPAADLAAACLGARLLALCRAEIRLVTAVVVVAATSGVMPPGIPARAGRGSGAIAAPAGPLLRIAGPRDAGRPGLQRVRPGELAVRARIWQAAARASPGRPAGEACPFGISHVPHAHRDSDENDHDNDCQADHERSHRTIQQAMTSRAAQVQARAAIDAGLTQ